MPSASLANETLTFTKDATPGTITYANDYGFDVNRPIRALQGISSSSVSVSATGQLQATSQFALIEVDDLRADALQLNGSTSGNVTVQAAAVSTPHTLTMPSAQGAASSHLTNNGSGALSWTAKSLAGAVFAQRSSAGQTIPNAYDTHVTFDTADANVRTSNYASVGVAITENGGFTNNTAAAITLLVSYQISWASNSTGMRTTWYESIENTGGTGRLAMSSITAANSTDSISNTGSCVVSLPAGEGFNIRAYQTSGGSLDCNKAYLAMSAAYSGRIQITRLSA